MSTILADSAEITVSSEAQKIRTGRYARGSFPLARPTPSTGSLSSDSEQDPPSLTFSSSASSSDVMTESDSNNSPDDDENSKQISSLSYTSKPYTPRVIFDEFDADIDGMITPRPRPSPIPLGLMSDDDAGYESGKESRRNAHGTTLVRPKLVRAESFKKKGSAQAMQQYRQRNLARASSKDNIKLSAPSAPTGKASSRLSRPTSIDLPCIKREAMIASVSTRNNVGLSMPSGEAQKTPVQTALDFSSHKRCGSPSPRSSPESDPPSTILKPCVRPTVDVDLSPIDELPPLLLDSSSVAIDTFGSATNLLPLPAILRDSEVKMPMSISAFLTLAAEAQPRHSAHKTKEKSNERNIFHDAYGISKDVNSAEKHMAMMHLGRPVATSSMPAAASSTSQQGKVADKSPAKRVNIPRVHSLAILQKKKVTMPRLPSFRDGVDEMRPSHAFLTPSPAEARPEKHRVTPWASPKEEEKEKMLRVNPRKALDGKHLLLKLRELNDAQYSEK